MIKILQNVGNVVVTAIGKVSWNGLAEKIHGRYYQITDEEQAEIRELLKRDYYIILTRRKTHLSTYAINVSHLWLSRFKCFGHYSHALMNTEDQVQTDDDFRLMEATNKTGVAFVPFENVFDCDSVALLKPKSMTVEEWTAALERLKTFEGRKYDTLYDLQDEMKMSCVEMVRAALKGQPNYEQDFANFENMIKKAKNLDPHMFYTCPDFEVVWEKRH